MTIRRELTYRVLPDEILVERRCLGRTELKVKPGQVGTSNATKPDNLGVLDYAHLRVPLPKDLGASGIFSRGSNRKFPESYFLMVSRPPTPADACVTGSRISRDATTDAFALSSSAAPTMALSVPLACSRQHFPTRRPKKRSPRRTTSRTFPTRQAKRSLGTCGYIRIKVGGFPLNLSRAGSSPQNSHSHD